MEPVSYVFAGARDEPDSKAGAGVELHPKLTGSATFNLMLWGVLGHILYIIGLKSDVVGGLRLSIIYLESYDVGCPML